MKIIKIAFIINFCVLAFSLNAQIVKLSASHYKEVWQNKIPISGGLKVGVLYELSENMKVQRSFFVKLPKGTYSQLCVKFNSRDGKFFADMQYDISKVKEGLIELEYPTKYWESIQTYTTDKIAILANISKQCNEGDEILVPASWNKAEIQNGINIILNSDKNPKIEIFDLDSKKASEITCEKLKGQDKVAYKCLCHIPFSMLPKRYELNVLHKIKKGTVISYKSYPITIRI